MPFSRPSIPEKAVSAVGEVLRSGWITTGSKCAEFERKFREYVGSAGGVALSSATAGMHLVLRAFGIGPGDEVITPSMTWVSTANLILLAGAVPVFADIDRDTLMVSSESIEECLTERTRLIVPVHFAGAPADMNPIRQMAVERGVPIVEDAAHALGTEYMGERVGGTGTSIFSFHPIKNITTGEGGMFCSDDQALLDRVRRLKFHGLGVDAHDRFSQGRAPLAELLEPGYKYNMTDISAVLGLTQLEHLDTFNAKRTELAMRYRDRLEAVDEILPLLDPPYPMKHAWHLFIVRLDTHRAGMSRNDFMAELKQRNIGTGLHFRAVHLQKYYMESVGTQRGMLPHTEWNSDRLCSLPLFPGMTGGDVDEVVDAIKDVLGSSTSHVPLEKMKTEETPHNTPSESAVSIVIPVCNEEENLDELLERCLATCKRMGRPYEIIFVDDGSKDRSHEMIAEMAERNAGRVVGLILNRNYGQHAAVMAGFAASRGDIVVTLDADLQNPPEEIPKLIHKMEEGYDVVGSVRVPRRDKLFRRVASFMINKAAQKATGVLMHDYGCMLRAYRRSVVAAMLECPERSTFIPVLANSLAHKTTELEVDHDKRSNGESKYGFWKLINLQFDLMTSITTAPLRLLSVIGAVMSITGIGFGLFLLTMRLIYGPEWAVQGVFTLFAVLFIFAGSQLIGMGLLGEYIGRIYRDVRARPRYFVQSVAGKSSLKEKDGRHDSRRVCCIKEEA